MTSSINEIFVYMPKICDIFDPRPAKKRKEKQLLVSEKANETFTVGILERKLIRMMKPI